MADPRRIRVIGIGSGHPEQLTGEAWTALSSVDYVVAARKSADDPLLQVRRRLCAKLDVPLVAVPDPERDRDDPADYAGAVRDWHAARVAAYADVLAERPGDVGFLVWGDPAFYDSTLRIVERLAATTGATYDVVPGISSPQLLAAAHRIVLHRVGQPVLFTTGRRLAGEVAAGHDNVLVMLDGALTCRDLDADAWEIWWGANLGTPGQRLVHGPLGEVLPRIEAERAAAASADGWVMDTYLLRRGASGAQVP
ncbi:precorrin-6A synthase (deacetylating) [Marmoricola sp. RAF53]|uniref:precorrin-6A synthase (deacetylating) n=1 Tax=Marmoricola sp. RAF53 TaxID=3233059 RepID=UPI003F98B3ED